MLKASDAEALLQNADRYRRPPKPRALPLDCYVGMGVDRQPECIAGIVVRTKSIELTAAVLVACRFCDVYSRVMSQWALQRTASPLARSLGKGTRCKN